MEPHELNVLALIKGDERYVFVYDEASRPALLTLFRDQAADPRVSLSWFDAAVLTQKAREQGAAEEARNPRSEIRNPKAGGSRISDFGFRISDLGPDS